MAKDKEMWRGCSGNSDEPLTFKAWNKPTNKLILQYNSYLHALCCPNKMHQS